MMEASGANDLTDLARKANLAHSTLTRPMALGANATWSLSAKTWQRLSEVSGVPVTFIGTKIIVPDAQPRVGDLAHQRRLATLLRFWNQLDGEAQDLFLSMLDAWAKRIAAALKSG